MKGLFKCFCLVLLSIGMVLIFPGQSRAKVSSFEAEQYRSDETTALD